MSEQDKILVNEIIGIGMFSLVTWALGAANANIFFCYLGWCVGSVIIYYMRRSRNN